MGRQALLAAVSWLSFGGSLAVSSFVFRDNQSAGSAPRLYRHVPGTVYASGAPYAAYSFQVPVVTQNAAASRVIPVKETSVFENANGYLKDSYGNRFVEALQSMRALPLKPFPQQYVQLQELPAHFAQPLAAAPHAFQQQPTQIVVGSHYRLPLQSAAPTPKPIRYSIAHPSAYAENFKSFAPVSFHHSFGSQFNPVQLNSHLAAVSHKPAYNNGQSLQEYSRPVSQNEHSVDEQHSTSSKAIPVAGDHKFQRLQEAPQESYEEETPAPRKVVHKEKAKLKVAAIKETPIPTVVNGKKTIVNVETKPPIPLLDINLLEPLTFDNPLVPQVQHFLPRIHEATYHKLPDFNQNKDKKYHKEFVAQKTKSYDSGVIKGKPKKIAPKKKHKSPEILHTYDDDYIPQATARPTVTIKEPDESPEISYEISGPNFKETYKEKAVKYNKETNSEPEHYTYGSNTRKEPVNYSYSHSSKEPVHIQEVRYEGKGEGPKHIIYKFKPEEQNEESEKSNAESEDSNESSEQSDDDVPKRSHHGPHQQYHSAKGSKAHDQGPEHREQEYHHKPNPKSFHNVHQNTHSHDNQGPGHREQEYHHKPNSYHKTQHSTHNQAPEHKEQEYHHKPGPSAHAHHNTHSSNNQGPVLHYPLDVTSFRPVGVAQYEENISISAPIKVDPNQHVQPKPHSEAQQPRSSPAPQQHSHHTHAPQHSKADSKAHHETPSTHVHEKTKQVYIQEEAPENDDSIRDLMKAMFGKDEDKEKDFENAYKNAAFGFPAYDKQSTDIEKDIYNPESYILPRHHKDYDIDHSPFQQYQHQGDEYPKAMRLSYKDDRDKTKDEYFLDYSISRPESLADRYSNKAQYYKLYQNQKPEKYVAHEFDNNKQKESAKLTAIPYSYYPVPDQKMMKMFAQYQAVPFATSPLVFEYDYSKGTPKDNSAHSSRPFQRYKLKTHFVEPQFQYGFEPIGIPQLLDSELAAMASSNNPESEKPGTRKKIYKENFYIKKTSMSDAGPNS